MLNEYNLPKTAPALPRWVKLASALILSVTLVAAGAVAFSPVGRRWWRNPASSAPVANVTEVYVRHDPELNHIFSPAVIRVPVGTTVTWHFEEVDEAGRPVPHNVIFADFGSEVQATGRYSYTFTQAGSYPYTCTLHALMNGRVEVYTP